ncbi:recombination-associated protein RdgC [Aquincola tertiaricarbonis]|uniref:Recombination-associated protein RdgC n=1 Tax=Aquincola tertiaricarbonis TaxID=391953 RepID=A0ABY4SBL0_AQUTE|nr:recombination-associated protein RdgC [Aquincola tertiaricarbonis]URI09985.1 recombination-associated protein RdgC [Aquincola tertiaricarbonis]
MFKNLIVYRIAPEWTADPAQLEAALDKMRFVPCTPTQPMSAGWVEPRGVAHAPLVEVVDGHWLLKLQVEHKTVPGAVVRRRAEEMAAQIEQQTGRKPGKKQMKELKEDALHELLPQAFAKRASVQVWIDPTQRLLLVDSGSANRADEVVTQLVKAGDGLALTLLQTAETPVAVMSAWLAGTEPPAAFSIDRECELKSPDEMKSVVRYARHALDIEEVREHIRGGKLPTRLALTWQGRVSFVLSDTGQIRKIAFLDGVFEGLPKVEKDEAFEADAAIATGELRQLIPDLVEALGGEHALTV